MSDHNIGYSQVGLTVFLKILNKNGFSQKEIMNID